MESVEFLGRYRLTQSDACFKLGRDSVLLAGFAPCAPGGRCVTWAVGWAPSCFCCPSGRRPWTGGGGAGPCRGRPGRRNLSDNGLEGQVLTGDLRDRALLKGDRFQLVIANPPYFRAGSGKSGGQARMDDTCPVDDLCRAAGRLAKTGGRFALVSPPRAAGGAFCRPSGARLEPKRLQLLSYGPSSPPYAVLVEAVKEGGPGLEILPVHYQTESAH